MRRTKTPVLLLLLSATVVIAALALSSAASLPQPPSGCTTAGGDPILSQRCVAENSQYRAAIASAAGGFWGFQAGVAVSFASLGLVVLVSPWRRKALPSVGFLCGSWFYSSLALIDVIQEPNYISSPLHDWARVIGNPSPWFGLFAFEGMLLATISLMVLTRSLAKPILYFAAPSVALLLLGIWAVSPISMALPVTNFAPSFLTNWVALAVASLLTLWGLGKPLGRRLRGKSRPPLGS